MRFLNLKKKKILVNTSQVKCNQQLKVADDILEESDEEINNLKRIIRLRRIQKEKERNLRENQEFFSTDSKFSFFYDSSSVCYFVFFMTICIYVTVPKFPQNASQNLFKFLTFFRNFLWILYKIYTIFTQNFQKISLKLSHISSYYFKKCLEILKNC